MDDPNSCKYCGQSILDNSGNPRAMTIQMGKESICEACRIARLPVWAQKYIAKLQDDLLHCHAALDKVQEEQTPVYWKDYMLPKFHIPGDATVVFLGTSGMVECRLRRVYGRRVLAVRTDGRMVIYPIASNSIEIESASL